MLLIIYGAILIIGNLFKKIAKKRIKEICLVIRRTQRMNIRCFINGGSYSNRLLAEY